jgi:hypothetical protein
MPDIFSRSTDKFGGSFSADQATVVFPALIAQGGADAGLLMQNLQTTYSQQITRVYEVGSPTIYYVGGRTAGQSQVARVVGPRRIAQAFYSTYGDVCNARTNSLHFAFETGCGGLEGSRAAYTTHFVVLTTVSLGVSAEQMMINESLAFMFSSLVYN